MAMPGPCSLALLSASLDHISQPAWPFSVAAGLRSAHRTWEAVMDMLPGLGPGDSLAVPSTLSDTRGPVEAQRPA